MAVERAAALLSDPKIEDQLPSQPALGTGRGKVELNISQTRYLSLLAAYILCVGNPYGQK
jgi:hypothetical protein